MAKFRVDSEVLSSKAKEVRNIKEEHKSAIDKLTSLVNGLSEIWEGQAQQTFVTSFEGMKSTFAQFEQSLENYAVALDKDAAIYAQAESEATSASGVN